MGESELGPDEQFVDFGGQLADQDEIVDEKTRIQAGLYSRLCQTYVIEKGMQI